jgi:hypothetical protein
MPSLTDMVMASVPVEDAGVGSAVNDVSRELGSALGVAILGSFISSIHRSNVEDELGVKVSNTHPPEFRGSGGFLGLIRKRGSRAFVTGGNPDWAGSQARQGAWRMATVGNNRPAALRCHSSQRRWSGVTKQGSSQGQIVQV